MEELLWNLNYASYSVNKFVNVLKIWYHFSNSKRWWKSQDSLSLLAYGLYLLTTRWIRYLKQRKTKVNKIRKKSLEIIKEVYFLKKNIKGKYSWITWTDILRIQ